MASTSSSATQGPSLADKLKDLCPAAWSSYGRVNEVLMKDNRLSRADQHTLTSEFAAIMHTLSEALAENAKLQGHIADLIAQPSVPSAPPQLFSEVARGPTRARSRSRTPKRKAEHVILVYPKDKKQEATQTKKMVTKSVCPTKMQAQIKSMRMIRNGGVRIACDGEADLEKVRKSIEESDQVQEKLEIQVPKLRNPKVVLYNIPQRMTKDEVKEALAGQNAIFTDEEFEILFPMKSKVKDSNHWVVEVNPGLFKTLMRKPKVYVDWSVIGLKEFLRETRCYNCNRFGHVAKHCKNQKSCRNCGGSDHEHKDCTEGAKCVNCTLANEKYGKNFNTAHAAHDKQCPSLTRELDFLTSKINYG